MSDCISIVQVATNQQCQEKLKALIYTELVLYVALLVYLLTLIGVSIFKHKVSGFTIYLLIMLTICLSCNLIPFAAVAWIIETQRKVTANVNVIKFFAGLTIYIGVASGSLVYWIFSIKYWCIALKIEFAIEEQDITQKDKLISWLMFVGIGTLLILAVSGPLFAIQGYGSQPWIEVLFGLLVLQLFVSCCFIADALRRLARTKVQNKTISVWMTVLFLTAYALELVGCVLPFDKNAVLFVSSFVAFGLIFGVLMLSTILYLIGVSSVTSDLTNSQEVLDIQKASLIDEDWPDDDLSFDQMQKQHEEVTLNV